jgi:tRNA-2-methylthio-N6-dimethylallyladenosine synthase
MDGQVPEQVKDERLQRLQALINERQLAFNGATVGRRTSVLLERPGKRPGQLIGKSPWLQSVHLETAAAIGDIVEVEIVSAGPNSLGAVLCPGEGRGPAARNLEPGSGLRRSTAERVTA